MGQSLSTFNSEMAMVFMHRIIENFTWLYQLNTEEIKTMWPTLGGIAGLSALINGRLQKENSALMQGVLNELTLVSELETFLRFSHRDVALKKAKTKGRAAYEFRLLKHIVDFLERRTKSEPSSGIGNSTIAQLTDLYSLRKDYYERFIKDCDDPDPLLMMLCSAEEVKASERLPEKDRTDFLFSKGGGMLFSAWQLATTISANLVRGENSLSATDAYWLGLVEEVIGVPELPCRRILIES